MAIETGEDADEGLEFEPRSMVQGNFGGPDEIELLAEATRENEEDQRTVERNFRFKCSERGTFSLGESLMNIIPRFFEERIMSKYLDDQDVTVLSQTTKSMRRFVRQTYGETKYTKLNARKFASSRGLLEFARLSRCPWTCSTFAAVARVGNIECLGYLLDTGCPYDDRAITACARGSHIEAMKFLRGNGIEWKKKDVLVVAMDNRDFDMLAYVASQPEQ